MSEYVVGIDAGTSSTRVCLFECTTGKLVSHYAVPTTVIYKDDGFSEMDADKLWNDLLKCIDVVVGNFLSQSKDNSVDQIKCIGITDQVCSTICWNKLTGKSYCNIPRNIHEITGFAMMTLFSSTKIQWIMENYKEFANDIEKGEAIFGTIDTWLLWNLTNGNNHMTDISNAGLTGLYDINKLEWSQEILDFYKIPRKILPIVQESFSNYGIIQKSKLKGVPVTAIIGDFCSSLYGQNCGLRKMTFGTASSVSVNTGEKHLFKDGLISNIAFVIDGVRTCICTTCSLYCSTSIKYLIDQMKIAKDIEEFAALADSVNSIKGVYYVSEFAGKGASLIGLKLTTNRAHICRSCLESLAYKAYREGTVYGVCAVASKSLKCALPKNKVLKTFYPQLTEIEREQQLEKWKMAFDLLEN
ncbi:hypothetical protein A3Q56_03533 [Intoshia linei]|uniref:Carbohydrate kinase FGGY N-terminal domain-containing protein n=1 Tax=Intoshia linei TaxID=1819745 RepID=A0A177B531_9BILA|nr:hypothetical protein A3Q56_03533 [Intoshia linei]